MTWEERKILATAPITWEGDLKDDCAAHWAGLLLRAEWMDHYDWWWAVYDMLNNEVIIDSSNMRPEKCTSGKSATDKAEAVAKAYIANGPSAIPNEY